MEKQQTAVEWLIDKLTDEPDKFLFLSDKPEMNELIKLIEQAKQKEEDQIMNAWVSGVVSEADMTAEQYYNETYKK